MKRVFASDVLELVSLHPEVAEFGGMGSAVDEEWVKKTEKCLGVPLTESYKWFLKNYVGGYICGDEIYSLYGDGKYDIPSGDIVYHYFLDKKKGVGNQQRIFVCRTDFGEQFFFDYSRFKDGECPICLILPSGEIIDFAPDFYGFLYKKIMDCIP
jgi:hypothetical protein